jgi:hypothetical protein
MNHLKYVRLPGKPFPRMANLTPQQKGMRASVELMESPEFRGREYAIRYHLPGECAEYAVFVICSDPDLALVATCETHGGCTPYDIIYQVELPVTPKEFLAIRRKGPGEDAARELFESAAGKRGVKRVRIDPATGVEFVTRPRAWEYQFIAAQGDLECSVLPVGHIAHNTRLKLPNGCGYVNIG